jgi:hypothetical protein
MGTRHLYWILTSPSCAVCIAFACSLSDNDDLCLYACFLECLLAVFLTSYLFITAMNISFYGAKHKNTHFSTAVSPASYPSQNMTVERVGDRQCAASVTLV